MCALDAYFVTHEKQIYAREMVSRGKYGIMRRKGTVGREEERERGGKGERERAKRREERRGGKEGGKEGGEKEGGKEGGSEGRRERREGGKYGKEEWKREWEKRYGR